jgi:hypothetical protein
MRFFKPDYLPTPSRDYKAVESAVEEDYQASLDYGAFLKRISPKLPEETRLFAVAAWYQDPRSHDCPHDAWLEEVKLSVADERRRTLNLSLTVLGAYQDRLLTFNYFNVTEFRPDLSQMGPNNLDDWLHDEYDIMESGGLSHEILWRYGAQWRIVAERITFSSVARSENKSKPQR